MKRFSSVDEILDFAIQGEIEAHDFYVDLAKKMENSAMQKAFEEFAIEELGHKMKLEAVKAGEFTLTEDQVDSLGIADYIVAGEPQADMTYAEALALAMKKEKEAYRMYLDLASVAESEDLTNTFMTLAQEEAKHKLRFEIEYDDVILKED
jgi:rubrerythrin